ncbi:MAG: NTP transferase domain-containing protein [Prevotella sp.]|nr:NTP transferase domain-containing protein [Prevotella sp.]
MKQAMIFAAGLGTRLRPLTDNMPKALVRVGEEPLLKHVIFRLRDAGFTRLVVNVHHFSQQIIDYLKANDNFGLDIRVSDETASLLDTGGGIRRAAELFDPNYPILIHNVDILSNVDLARFYGFDPKVMCVDCGVPHLLAGAQLLVSWRKTKRYLLFDDQMLLVGWVNLETGEVKSPYPEVKSALQHLTFPITPTDEPLVLADCYRAFAFSGIHCFSPRMFPLMVGLPEKFPIMDFYLTNCRKMPVKGYVQPDLKLMDVGKLDTLHEAEEFLKVLGGR